jgi:hypothetical protein
MRPQHISDHVGRSSDDQLARDLLHGEIVFQLSRSARRDGDAKSFASARRQLGNLLRARDEAFRSQLIKYIVAEHAPPGQDIRHVREGATLDLARLLPEVVWMDLGPVEPRGRA